MTRKRGVVFLRGEGWDPNAHCIRVYVPYIKILCTLDLELSQITLNWPKIYYVLKMSSKAGMVHFVVVNSAESSTL